MYHVRVGTRYWDNVTARELFDLRNNSGSAQDLEVMEWDNLAFDPAYHEVIYAADTGLHAQLVRAIKQGLTKPILNASGLHV